MKWGFTLTSVNKINLTIFVIASTYAEAIQKVGDLVVTDPKLEEIFSLSSTSDLVSVEELPQG